MNGPVAKELDGKNSVIRHNGNDKVSQRDEQTRPLFPSIFTFKFFFKKAFAFFCPIVPRSS
jgi:hypothetical protein